MESLLIANSYKVKIFFCSLKELFIFAVRKQENKKQIAVNQHKIE